MQALFYIAFVLRIFLWVVGYAAAFFFPPHWGLIPAVTAILAPLGYPIIASLAWMLACQFGAVIVLRLILTHWAPGQHFTLVSTWSWPPIITESVH